MNYLQIIVELTDSFGTFTAISANGHDLGKSPGCIAYFFQGKKYPLAHDYFNYLGSQGWELVSTNQLGIDRSVYTFRGGGAFLIEWRGDRWWPIFNSDSYDSEY